MASGNAMKRKSVRYSDPLPTASAESDPFDLDEHAYDDYADESDDDGDEAGSAKRDES